MYIVIMFFTALFSTVAMMVFDNYKKWLLDKRFNGFFLSSLCYFSICAILSFLSVEMEESTFIEASLSYYLGFFLSYSGILHSEFKKTQG